MNQRIPVLGHYLIVTSDLVRDRSDRDAAADLAQRSLVRFRDRTCEGVRLALIAESVMLT